ncbi:conserved hypothetical protein [Shewanella baltica OS195]|uniref:Uncharacterized protein n=1 Tax=Shewanella baltica (strain OS195) TaxID=399599 RepID=A9KVY1_SHEB9|nr:hypothetical protein [Shewanella baltica]ABX51555.1 conserved hypothetical protein [Shewanella baltica OS195]
MSNNNYLNSWDGNLLFHMNDDYTPRCDFNRMLYKGCPNTKYIQQGNTVEYAHRYEIIFQFKERFEEKMKEGCSHATLSLSYIKLMSFLKWCDTREIEAFSKQSLEAYMAYQFERVRLGLLKATSYSQIITKMGKIFNDYLDYPSDWLIAIPTIRRGDNEPFEVVFRNLCHFSIIKEKGMTHE